MSYPGHARGMSARTFLPVLFLSCALLGFFPRNVGAKPTFPPIVQSTYTLKAGGILSKSGCGLCHLASGPPQLNPYGAAIQTALKTAGTKTLSAAVLHSLDTQDADGDTFTTAAEFAADTLPGDSGSKPAGAGDAAHSSTQNSGTQTQPSTNTPANGLEIFSPNNLIFPKHAQHRVLVHFPIALFVISLFFDLLGLGTKNRSLLAAGYYNLLMAVITAPITFVTGLLAWQFVYGGAPLTGILLWHLISAILTTLLLLLLWALRRSKKETLAEGGAKVYIAIGLLTLLVIGVTGHIGGALLGG